MPTILNNSCINRVSKIKKFKFTSNDLTAMKVTPYSLLTLKEGSISRFPFLAICFLDSDCDYLGSIKINSTSYAVPTYMSYFWDNFRFSVGSQSSTEANICTIQSMEDFEVGVNRPDIELHLYYFEENVSVDFDFDYELIL